MKPRGTKLAVYTGKAKRTNGGLTKSGLRKNKHGKVVSKKLSRQATRRSNLGSFLQKPKRTRPRRAAATRARARIKSQSRYT